MFLRLGLTNCLRQLGRNLLVLICMVLSAISLTSALSYSEGLPQASYGFYRSYLGGDVLVSPVKWMGQAGDGNGEPPELVWRRLTEDGLNRLEMLYPELSSQGFLTPSHLPPRQSFTDEDLQAMRRCPGVSDVRVLPQFPVDMTSLWLTDLHYSPFTLQPLPDEKMLGGSGRLSISALGRPDSQLPLVWINSHVSVSSERLDEEVATIDLDDPYWIARRPTRVDLERVARRKLQAEMKLPNPGETVQLRLPKLRLADDGQYALDYREPVKLAMQVVGEVQVPTRELVWPVGGSFDIEQAYLHQSSLYVTAETWDWLVRQVTGDLTLPICNVSLQVEMGQIRSVVAELQRRFPQFTFIDVEQFAERMEATSRLDFFYRAPDFVYSPVVEASMTVPAELGPVLGLLLFLIAGMLLAARMLTGASARRSEIGILKSLGARRRDILTMALAEAAAIALVGSVSGFLLVRTFGISVELGNGVAWTVVLQRTLREGGLVVGVASLVALLFAALPARRLACLTVMGVLRGD